ncbi:MAG: hypothetical protein SGBAC_013395, partial [Bacillariaceae sp.]
RLGVKLGKRSVGEQVDDDDDKDDDEDRTTHSNIFNSYVHVAALDEKRDSLLNPATVPIQVGDLVISFNDIQLCCNKSMDLETLQEVMSQATGVITIRLYRHEPNDNSDFIIPSDKEGGLEAASEREQELIVQQAVFVQPKHHTCLPMDLDFEIQILSNQRCLTVGVNGTNDQNDWLSRSCLEPGQIVLAINGSRSYNLEEEDARIFLQTKCELASSVSITTLGVTPPTKKSGESKDDKIPTMGKENETSKESPSKEKSFPAKWNRPSKKSMMWSSISSGQKETEEEKKQKEERKLDAQYIQETTIQIRGMLAEAKKDRSIDTAGKLPMFTSCRKLFVAMKHRIDACARERGTGEAYFQLYVSLSKDALPQYARILKSSLTAATPTKRMGGSGTRFLKMTKIIGSSSSSSSSIGTERRFGYDEKTADNERVLCHIFNTSKYCVDTIEQMEEMIRNTIHFSYASKVDTTSQQEVFDEIAAKAMEFLISLLSNQVGASGFAEMTRLPWKKWDQVQDTNHYVYSICHHVESYISTAEGLLSPAYFCTLCDKLAMDIMKTFDSIMLSKCNQTTTTGKQQLLLDVHTLKSFFLGKLVEDHKKGALVSSWTIYEKMVSEKFQRMEALLRVASVSESDLKDFMDDAI